MQKRVVLSFSPDLIGEPVTCRLIKDYQVDVNILNADISSGSAGRLMLEITTSPRNWERAKQYLESRGVLCDEPGKHLHFKAEACIHCGACTSVCHTAALSLHYREKTLQFDPSRCVACGFCIKACPLQLFTLKEVSYEVY